MDKTRNISLKEPLTGSLETVLGLVILVAVFTAFSNTFLTPSSIRNALIQSGTNVIITMGMTYVIISGNIDISVSASLVPSSRVGAILMVETGNVRLSVATVLLTGVLLGLFSGSLVAYLDFPPFTVMLSTVWLLRRMTYLYMGGQAVAGLPQGITSFAMGSILYVPNIVWLTAIIYIIGHVALQGTTTGCKACAVGDNSEPARLSGISVERVTLAAFVLSGFCAALGGIMYTGRPNSDQPIVGQSYGMHVIAVAVIGGTSLTKGGIESMVGTLVGVVFIFVFQNGLTIPNINTHWQQVCMGVALLLTVGLNRLRKSVKQRRRKK